MSDHDVKALLAEAGRLASSSYPPMYGNARDVVRQLADLLEAEHERAERMAEVVEAMAHPKEVLYGYALELQRMALARLDDEGKRMDVGHEGVGEPFTPCSDSACSLPHGHDGLHYDKRDGARWDVLGHHEDEEEGE